MKVLVTLALLFVVVSPAKSDFRDIAPWRPDVWALGGADPGVFGWQPWDLSFFGPEGGTWFMSFPFGAPFEPDLLAGKLGIQNWQEVEPGAVGPQVFAQFVDLPLPASEAVLTAPEPTSAALFAAPLLYLWLRRRWAA
jgi:hypothetical protein